MVQGLAIAPRRNVAPGALSRPVAIVVPIYNAFWDVARCVRSVLHHRPTRDCRLILVNDASTEPGLAEYLRAVATHVEGVELLENAKNLGFVGTANRGMRAAGGDDVLLLNSDTIATAGFADGLQRCVLADARTGLASPVTNNGTICAVPEWLADNPLPARLDIDDVAECVRRGSARLRPELVTAVGFCMYVRAEVLARVGYFDEAAFGRGYGEENDLCERAKKAGFAIRLCDDVYVYHRGGASFGGETDALLEKNLRTLESRHPGYDASVQAFIAANPLRDVQEAVRLALERGRSDTARALLFLIHSPIFSVAGGTEFHVLDLVRALKLPRVVVAYPLEGELAIAEIRDGDVERRTGFAYELPGEASRFWHRDAEVEALFAEVLRAFDVGVAHVHHLMYWPLGLWRAFAAANAPYVTTCHDYYAVCPSHDLYDLGAKKLCDAEGARCPQASCLSSRFEHTSAGRPPAELNAFLASHRAEVGALLANAARVIFPSAAARDIVAARYPLDERAIVIGHGYDAPAHQRPPAARLDGPLRVAFLGAIANPQKGAHEYLELLGALRDADVEWNFFGDVEAHGYARKLEALRPRGRLIRHGAYRRSEIAALLARNDIDLCVLLSPWAETFSYTLSEALTAGVPALVSSLGAPRERIEGTELGFVAESTAAAAKLLARFAVEPGALAPQRAAARAFAHKTVHENATEYAALYERILSEHATSDARSLDAQDAELLARRRSLVRAYVNGRELADARHVDQTLPRAPEYQSAWWYPYFLKVKPLIPASVRQRGRRGLVAREQVARARVDNEAQRVVQHHDGLLGRARAAAEDALRWGRTRLDEVRGRALELPFHGASARWIANEHLRLVEEKPASRLYEARGGDPRLITHVSFATRPIKAIEFRMRVHDGVRKAFAQLFWAHAADEDFSEAKSIRVPLVAKAKGWRTYRIDLAASPKRGAWLSGSRIGKIRFDPLSVPGELELDGLTLHRA